MEDLTDEHQRQRQLRYSRARKGTAANASGRAERVSSAAGKHIHIRGQELTGKDNSGSICSIASMTTIGEVSMHGGTAAYDFRIFTLERLAILLCFCNLCKQCTGE